MRLYGSFFGFRYYIKPKPLLGAYVGMENFARGMLTYGGFDEYHAYFDDQFLANLSQEEMKKAYFRFERLKVLRLKALVENPGAGYEVLHFEQFSPYEEVFFRNILSQRNTPVTRRVYAIATVAHLISFLELCLLTDGGRPYDSIIVPSHPTREALLAYYEEMSSFTAGRLRYKGRVDVIPHGIWVEDFAPRDKLRSRNLFGLPPQAVVLLSMARISWVSKMNYDRLLAFFARLTAAREAELFLVIAGADLEKKAPDLLRAADEAGVAGRVKLITDFKDENKADIIAGADIFISLSDNLQESFGITLIEAMAMGLPVLCTDWDGYKDIVDEGITGYRIPTTWKATESAEDVLSSFRDPWDHTAIHRASREVRFDMDLLLARTRDLVNDENKRRVMGEKGREKVKKVYSIAAEISACEALWQELGDRARRDKGEYPDLRPILNYNYPKHFRSYPTRFEAPEAAALVG